MAGYATRLEQAAARNLEDNAAAKNALDKMPGDGAQYYKALAMPVVATAGANVAKSFGDYFAATMGTSFVQNSFWAKLVTEYAAQFLFAISPAVKWALPIPFCAGLNWKDGGKLIRASEYSYANFNANMSQLIESVDLIYPTSTATGLPVTTTDDAGNQRLSYYKPCGSYPENEKDQNKKGLKLFKTAPVWTAGLDPGSLTGLSSTSGARSTVAPKAGDQKLPGDVKDTGTAFNSIKDLFAAFAKHMYATEVLQQRYGELSGPLRFDIAPGSIVKIATPPRDRENIDLTAAETEPNEYVIASVMSVSFVINSERATAGTSFTIAHTKTEAEVGDGSPYVVDRPPLYKEAWSGGPLAELEQ
jgi:hypothetical protein